MAALLEDIVASLPEGATYSYTVRKVSGQSYVGFDEQRRVNVFASSDVLIAINQDGYRYETPSGFRTMTYTITDHLAEEDDRIFYAGDIDGRVTVSLPRDMLQENGVADTDYILVQEADTIRISGSDKDSEYEEYVYLSMGKVFEGIAVHGTVPIPHWVAVDNSLYYLPSDEEEGSYWFEFGFGHEHPRVICPAGTTGSEEYKISMLHNKIENINPRYATTSMFFGRIKNGQYSAMLPDLSVSNCSVLCLVPDILYQEGAKPVQQVSAPTGSAQELAEEVLCYTDGEYDGEPDRVIAALQFALNTLENLYVNSMPVKQDADGKEIAEKAVADLFAGFDLGDF